MCIPIWFGFGPHSEDGYGLSPAKRVSKIGAVSIVLMLIGWIMELIAICSAHWVILSTYGRNSYNQLVSNTQAHGLWTSCTGVFALFPICHDTPGKLSVSMVMLKTCTFLKPCPKFNSLQGDLCVLMSVEFFKLWQSLSLREQHMGHIGIVWWGVSVAHLFSFQCCVVLCFFFCLFIFVLFHFWLLRFSLTVIFMGRRGRDCMVVGFTTIYAIGAYHHWSCEFKSRSSEVYSIHYVIKFVSDWHIVESGVKNHQSSLTVFWYCVDCGFKSNQIKQINQSINVILIIQNSTQRNRLWNEFRVRVMVFNATFNNISVITWRSVLLVEDTGVPGENHRPATRHWQTEFKDIYLSYGILYHLVYSDNSLE